MPASRSSRSSSTQLVLLASLSVLIAVPVALGAEQIRIKPAANADEQLFLVRLLETLYETWPTDATDQDAFVAAAAQHRATAIRLREHCRRERVDASLEGCFDEFVKSLDAYTDFLVNIDQIKREAAEQAKKDTFNSGFDAGVTSAGTYGAMRQGDHSVGQAAAGALVAGGIQYMVDSWDKSQKRDAAEKRAVDAAARNVQDRITTSLANAQAAARKLTKGQGMEQDGSGLRA